MKSYIHIVHSILIIGIILLCAYLLLDNRELARQLDSVKINKDSVCSYEKQDQSIIITFIGVGFALFAFLTFQGVQSFFIAKVDEVKHDYEKERESYKSQKHRLEKLERDLNYQHGKQLVTEYKSYYDVDNVKYLMVALTACEKFCFVLNNPIDENELFISSLRGQVKDIISDAYKVSDSYKKRNKKIDISDITTERLKVRFNMILKEVDDEDYTRMGDIISQLNF